MIKIILAIFLLLGLTPASQADPMGELGIRAKQGGTKTTPPAFFIKGQLQQGGFFIGRLPSNQELVAYGALNNGQVVRVMYHGRTLPLLTEQKLFFIGFDRDDETKQEIIFALDNGKQIIVPIYLTLSDYYIQSITGIKNKYVNPDPKEMAMIQDDNKAIVSLRQTSDPTSPLALDDFIWPAEGRISGIYGSQRILNNEPRRPHYGVDIALDIGTPVMAPQGGRILLARNMFLSGKTMVIDHGMGVQSVFMHLDGFKVRENDIITQGQVVALSGNTGRTSGPHLHWQVNWYEKKFNPQFLVKNRTTAKN